MSTFRVTSLPVGRNEIPGPKLFWMHDWDQWYPLLFQVILIQGGGLTTLVNTGPGRDLTVLNDRWTHMHGPRTAMRSEKGEFILDQLAKHNVRPEEVTHVILTPLQLYTVSNVLSFVNAEICISRRGWVHFHTTHAHPHDNRGTSIPDETLVHLVTDVWPRVRLLEDEDQLVPGLRTWWAGVHHRASLVVEVDTSAGTVAVSDAFFYRENLERDHPVGIAESLEEAQSAYARVRRTADVVLPLYDPKNLMDHPDGSVS